MPICHNTQARIALSSRTPASASAVLSSSMAPVSSLTWLAADGTGSCAGFGLSRPVSVWEKAKQVAEKAKSIRFKGAPLQMQELRASLRQRGRGLFSMLLTQTEVCSARINSCPDTRLLVAKIIFPQPVKLREKGKLELRRLNDALVSSRCVESVNLTADWR